MIATDSDVGHVTYNPRYVKHFDRASRSLARSDWIAASCDARWLSRTDNLHLSSMISSKAPRARK